MNSPKIELLKDRDSGESRCPVILDERNVDEGTGALLVRLASELPFGLEGVTVAVMSNRSSPCQLADQIQAG